jgi:hypothetical protein
VEKINDPTKVNVTDEELNLDISKIPPDFTLNVDELRKLLKFFYRGYKVPKIISDTLWDTAVREVENKGRAVLVKRDPNVERDRISAMFVKIVDGGSIRMHPSSVRGFGADFDGDSTYSYISYFKPNKNNKVVDFDDITWYSIHMSEFLNVIQCSLYETKTKGNIMIKKFKVDEEVYVNAIDKNTGEITKKKVTEFSIHDNIKMYKVARKKRVNSISSIHDLWVSEDHSMVVYDSQTSEIKNISPKDILSDTKNKFLIRTLDKEKYTKLDIFNELAIERNNVSDTEFGLFMGSWIGDGYLSYTGYKNKDSEKKDTGGVIGFCSSETQLGENFGNTLKQLTDNKVTINEDRKSKYPHPGDFIKKNGDPTAVALRTKTIDTALRRKIQGAFGKGAANKTLPPWMISCTDEFLYGLFAGYLDTDGTINKDYVAFTTKSKSLCDAFMLVFKNRFGLDISVFKEKRYITPSGSVYIKQDAKIDPSKTVAEYYLFQIKINNKTKSFFSIINNILLHSSKKQLLKSAIINVKETFNDRISFVPFSLVKDMSIKDRKEKLGLTQDHITKIKKAGYCQKEVVIPEDILESSNLNIETKTLLKKQNNKEIEMLPCELLDIEYDQELTIGYDLTVEDYYTFTTADGIFVWDSCYVDTTVYTKNADKYLKHVVHIKDFINKFKCKLIEEKIKPNGVVVQNYEVGDDVYVDAINIETNDITKKKITHWSIHKNIDMYELSSEKHKEDIVDMFVSSDHSLVVYDNETNKFLRMSPEDILKNKERYSLVKYADG